MASLLDLDTLQRKVENALTGATLSDERKAALAAVFDAARAEQADVQPNPAPADEAAGTKAAANKARAAVGNKSGT